MSINLDPVTLAVIQSGLNQVCNEMDLAFCRALGGADGGVNRVRIERTEGLRKRA